MVFQIAGWSLRRPVAALSSELLGLPMVIAGGTGIAPEFAPDGGLVALELLRDGGDRESPLVQDVDLAALVVLQVAELPRHGDFSPRIGQSGP